MPRHSLGISTDQCPFSVGNLDAIPLFWRVREFNSTDAGYPVPAGLCTREQTQLQLIYRYRCSLRVLDNIQAMIAPSSFQFHQPELQKKATMLLIFNCCCGPLKWFCLLILDKVIFEFLKVRVYEVFGAPLKGHMRYDCSTNHQGLFFLSGLCFMCAKIFKTIIHSARLVCLSC